mmetsp:Transcript_4916/g.6014  ORF Transcript_4916/g.6014 Transcript_4916/m.6014 type:complete len:120 (+) Transcript_4916:60-419(+)
MFSHALEEAAQKHIEGRKCMKELKFKEAVVLLEEALQIRSMYVDVPPFVCIVDIATLHLDIGRALQALNLGDAMNHFTQAWSMFRDYLGCDHPLTQDAHQECILIAARRSQYSVSAVAA